MCFRPGLGGKGGLGSKARQGGGGGGGLLVEGVGPVGGDLTDGQGYGAGGGAHHTGRQGGVILTFN